MKTIVYSLVYSLGTMVCGFVAFQSIDVAMSDYVHSSPMHYFIPVVGFASLIGMLVCFVQVCIHVPTKLLRR